MSFWLKKKKRMLERLVWALWEDGGQGWKVSKYHLIWENESMDQQHKHHHCYYHYRFTLSFKTLQKDVTTILIIRLLSVYIYIYISASPKFWFWIHLPLDEQFQSLYIYPNWIACLLHLHLLTESDYLFFFFFDKWLPYSTNHLSTRKLLMRILVIKTYHG